jgi:5'-3' exonuclease
MPLVNTIDKAEVIVALDIHNFMLRCYFAKGFAANAKNAQKYPTGHIYLALQKVRAALMHYGLKENKRVVLVLSAHENSGVRKKMYPKYKATREAREYTSYEVKDVDGNIVDKTRDPIEDGMEFLQCFPSVSLEIPNGDGETDDALAVMSKKYGKTKRIYIVSEDHDDWALMSDSVVITSKPGEEYGKADLMRQYGITKARKLPLVKAILGDTSDNIENVPGLSEKTYMDVLASQKVDSHYFDLHRIFEATKKTKEDHGLYAYGFYRELRKFLKQNPKSKLVLLLGYEKDVIFRERLVKLRTKIEVRYTTNRGDIPKLKRLLDWYALKKDYNSAVVLASGSSNLK